MTIEFIDFAKRKQVRKFVKGIKDASPTQQKVIEDLLNNMITLNQCLLQLQKDHTELKQNYHKLYGRFVKLVDMLQKRGVL